MSIDKKREQELAVLCNKFRIDLIKLLYNIQTGHPGGSLSCTEILTLLYQEVMKVDPQKPDTPDRDRFVLSKGHAAPMLYLNLAHRGFFSKDELKSLRQAGSKLQGHPCAHKTPGVDISTGPLGLGFAAGLGIALSGRINRFSYYTYVLLGDGEIQEGVVWETAMTAAKYKANRFIAILDYNGVQLDGTVDEIMPIGDVGAKFSAFGWNVLSCDGHDIASLSEAIDQAKANRESPSMIIAKTVKGKGVSFMEGKSSWHGKAIDEASFKQAIRELGGE